MRNSRPLFGTLQQLGQPLYMCLTPDGYKNTQEAWLNPDAMMWRLTFATALGSARLPVSAEPRWTNEAPRMTPAMASESVTPVRAETIEPTIRPQPVSFVALADTLGNRSTAETAQAIREAPEELKAAIILGSPEFMRH